MSFAHPWVLLLQIVPVWLLVWTWKRKGQLVLLPLDHVGAPDNPAWKTAIDAAESIPPLLLSAALFLLAGPEIFGEPKSRRVLTNIEFCVDVSGSMTEPFGDGQRYDASMKAIQ